MPLPPAPRPSPALPPDLARRGILTTVIVAGLGAVIWAALVWSGSGSPLDAQNGSLRLQPRWNLVAAPTTTTAQLLFTYLLDVQSAHRWNDATGQFESWRRGAPDAVQTLVQVTVGEGLWIEVTGPIDWELPPLAENPALPETAGFRLVGWVENDAPARDALAQLGGDRLFGWDEVNQRFRQFDPALPPALNSLLTVEHGRAYWLLTTPDTLPAVGLQLLTDGADQPVDVVAFFENELLVVEQAGRVRRLNVITGAFGVTVIDISDRVRNSGERGLLSLALDPNFETNGFIYLWYWLDGQNLMRLGRISTNGGPEQGSELVILEVAQPFGNHNGGRLLFGPDGLLYLSLGDGGSQADPQGNGQNLGTLLGSIIRIDVDGASVATPYVVPPGNPFIATPGARPEIFAYGFRNPWRMSFDTQTGALWVGDVGQGEIEEIDIVTAGGNYGWNLFEGDECFDSPTCSSLGLTGPVAFYSHDDGCSITGGVVYRGARIPALNGVYLFADYCSGTIWGSPASAPGEIQTLNLGIDDPVSFGTDPAGEVYVVGQNGDIWKIVAP